MATKKTTTQKTKLNEVKQAAPKAAASKASTAQSKAQPKAKSKSKTTAAYAALLSHLPDMKRPPNNPAMPWLFIERLNEDLNEVKTTLEDYAAHLRSLDRKRLNGVGIERQGFIDRAMEYAIENPEFLPHYLTLEKFQQDDAYFISFRTLFDLNRQIGELLWNITIQSADVVFTDALEFYNSVQEASKRRVDAAESIFLDLEQFFKRGKRTSEEPTEKEVLRDAKALLHGKREGKIVIENIKPKTSGGKRKVIDEKLTANEQFKETAEGEIDE